MFDAARSPENSPLVRQFYRFYSEVIRQKRQVSETGGAAIQPKEIPAPLLSASDQTAYPVYRALCDILEGQEQEARRYGGEYGVKFYKEAQYVMTALADEIFLHLDWPGKEDWKASHLLEYRFFDTYVAGEKFFDKLEKLLREHSTGYKEMAVIYFLALSLGFEGKYRDQEDKGQLEFYRRQLFAFIFQRDPSLKAESAKLFPQPYVHSLPREKAGESGAGGLWNLLRGKGWLVLTSAFLLLFLLISHGIWLHFTSDLLALAENIIRKSGGGL